MTNPYVNSRTKITGKKTLGQIDEVEKFVQSDVRKIIITDNIWFSRYLFLVQLNRILVLYTCTDCNSIFCTKYWYFRLNPVRFCSLCILPAIFDQEPKNA